MADAPWEFPVDPRRPVGALRAYEPDPPTHAYRIGWWTHRWWPTREQWWHLLTGRMRGARSLRRRHFARMAWRRLRLLRRPHRPWQAEMVVRDCSCNARRAFTADGATRRAIALHRRRMAATLEAGTPVSGVKGKCWASLTEEERAACR